MTERLRSFVGRAVYPGRVTVSAHDVAREIRRELPDVGDKKLHKLLYLCQGHHLAALGAPLFNEEMRAFDMGPLVDRLWRDEKAGRSLEPIELGEAAMNTVLSVVSRYGGLTGRELEVLSHGQEPWIVADQARRRGASDVMSLDTLSVYFSSGTADVDDDPRWPSDASISEWLAGGGSAPPEDVELDNLDRLRRRSAGA